MRLLLTLLLSCYLFAVDATLKIEKNVDQRAKIAVIDSSDPGMPLGRKSYEIFTADLKITGHYRPDGLYHDGSFNGPILNPDLRAMEYLLKYRISESGNGVSLDVKVLKGGDSSLVFERKYSIGSQARYPFLIHRAVTDLNAAMGFTPVDWLNRYVLFARYTGRRESEVVLADYTFTYIKPIIRGGLNIFPVWGDAKQRTIYYTDYSGKLPTLYRLDLTTGQRTRILDSQGMLVCSDVSRDGKRLLLTMAPSGQPDIYEYNVATGEKRQLTTYSGIDVGGKYADKERSMVFVSNRLGYANIFKKPLAGGPITQLVFHGSNNDSCDAFDNKVVYSSKEKSSFGKAFNLYLTTTDGDYTRPLTSGGINQFPRFSNDGNTVLYIKRSEAGNSIGYIGLQTDLSILFPLGEHRIQSIDW
ncbi:Tol-Pal system protein TolB [Nitratifractor salsuginis]|uniref:Translocation protein TolB n=1 Tax=Nitratifractor salsuginis (strain DSM 16511 / JCM 12458 / E9I37-1) TaxID=749222 RepID=E6X0E6_NITSE|nr:Tol-Pal system protein TolB [Nitratifractor salsuginis]ADV46796.1 translocation protein TolB [Nitratifractor salsuginis DSM 16511]